MTLHVAGTVGEAAVHLRPSVSAARLARALGMRRAKVYGHLRAKTWPGAVRLNARRWRIPTAEVARWLAAREGITEAEARYDLAHLIAQVPRLR